MSQSQMHLFVFMHVSDTFDECVLHVRHWERSTTVLAEGPQMWGRTREDVGA